MFDLMRIVVLGSVLLHTLKSHTLVLELYTNILITYILLYIYTRKSV